MVNVIEILLKIVKDKGDYIAVKDINEELTYKQLLSRAYTLSKKINEIIDGKNNLVLIVTTKSVESVLSIWGVVCSGNFYVCVDSKVPEDRFNMIINKVKPAMIIYMDDNSQQKLNSNISSLTMKDVTDELIDYEIIRKTLNKKHIIDVDPLYMVFTSGSTGEPKAIVKNHQSIIAFAESFVSEFELSSDRHEIFGNQASFDFDVSAKDIFISVFIGATLCLIPNRCFLVPSKLATFLQENEISILIWATSALKYVKKYNCFKNIKPSSISKVFFSGESMPVQCIDYWRENLPETTFVNLYAPSEVTGNCLFYVVSDDISEGILPLDSMFNNIDVLIIGDDNKMVNDGEKGEIYVRGCFLSKGYYKDMKKTMKGFVQNPIHNDYSDIVYKTGDYVVKKGDKLYFAGRVDNQIKHMGHRIELEEIESNCYAVSKNESLCVIYDNENEKIVLLTDSENYIGYDELVSYLKLKIPKYMIPHEILYIKELPLNSRGKIDRITAKSMYEVMKNA